MNELLRCLGTDAGPLAYAVTRGMAMRKELIASGAVLALVMTAGCRIQVDKDKEGHDKNVKIETPMGGLHVRADDVAAADVGLPAYPGATIAPDKDGDKSADVHLGFGEWQLRVKVVTYVTGDSQDKVIAFYQKALGRYGDVIQCQNNQPIGTPTMTREGLTCSEDKNGSRVHTDDSLPNLRAGSKRHQHIVGIEKNTGSGTRFSLVELQLPAVVDGDKRESN
jgi:hypothetical protein